jgi:hypothetical protein
MPLKLAKPQPIETKMVIDPHCHVYSNPRKPAHTSLREALPLIGNPKRFLLNPLEAILQQMTTTEINTVALTRAGDDQVPERIVSQILNLPDTYGAYLDSHMTQVIDPTGKSYTFIFAEETFTPKGHVLLLGMPLDARVQLERTHLSDVRQYTKKDPLVTIIADHPFDRGGLGTKGSLADPRVREWVEAYEWNSLATKKANQTALASAVGQEIPIIYSSDAHRFDLIGKGATKISASDLDFSSGRNLVASTHEAIISGKSQMARAEQSPFSAKLHHAYMVATDHKLDWSKKDSEDPFDLDAASKKIKDFAA